MEATKNRTEAREPRRNPYTRQARRRAQREINDALAALHEDKTTDLAFDSDALDALTGFAPDWML